MRFLGSLGIDLKLLIAQIINFGLLLWLLSKFLYGPIIEKIEKDEIELKKAQKQNEDLAEQKELFLKQRKEEIAIAKRKAKEIIKEAEEISEEIRSRSMREANNEKRAVIKQIKTRLAEVKNDKKTKK